MELFRRTPWYIKHTFLILAWLAIIYLFMQRFDWNEYEEDPLRRYLRDAQQEAATAKINPGAEAPWRADLRVRRGV